MTCTKADEPRHEETCFLHMQKQKRNDFVSATEIVKNSLISKSEIQASSHLLCVYTGWLVSDLVGIPEDTLCRDAAIIG